MTCADALLSEVVDEDEHILRDISSSSRTGSTSNTNGSENASRSLDCRYQDRVLFCAIKQRYTSKTLHFTFATKYRILKNHMSIRLRLLTSPSRQQRESSPLCCSTLLHSAQVSSKLCQRMRLSLRKLEVSRKSYRYVKIS